LGKQIGITTTTTTTQQLFPIFYFYVFVMKLFSEMAGCQRLTNMFVFARYQSIF